MEKILKAIEFATKVHWGQKRKGKEMSYISHPLSVGLLLASAGAEEDVIIAGILHDTIEDTETTYEEIEKLFGKKVADLVNDVTEKDKSLPWKERKEIALEELKVVGGESVLLKTADVLQNMDEQIADYKVLGDKMFERFNAGKKDQLEKYIKLVEVIRRRKFENLLLPPLEKRLLEIQSLWS